MSKTRLIPRIGLYLVVAVFALAGCSGIGRIMDARSATLTAQPLEQTPTMIDPNAVISATLTNTPASPADAGTPAAEPAASTPESPTELLAATPENVNIDPGTSGLPAEWQAIEQRMAGYGLVHEELISESYRAALASRIEKYGEAKNILSLEYHGDEYTMYEGRYSLTPQAFKAQVDYLMSQDYHFVTLPETEAFINGRLQLPARSVILTSDISSQHVGSLLSMQTTFTDLEAKYGYKPHMQVFIWTGDMLERPGIACDANSCWEALRQVKESPYFSFGSHSNTHPDFTTLGYEQLKPDWEISRKAIKDELGLTVYALAWPFEACGDFAEAMLNIGFTVGYGGSSKPLDENFVSINDPKPLCLPRMLPPAPDGTSMRPDGYTLPMMLEAVEKLP